MKHNFGLLNRSYETDQSADKELLQWQHFKKYVDALVKASDSKTKYKVVYVGRHGEGYRMSTLVLLSVPSLIHS